jgi:hypothetical protein
MTHNTESTVAVGMYGPAPRGGVNNAFNDAQSSVADEQQYVGMTLLADDQPDTPTVGLYVLVVVVVVVVVVICLCGC